MKRDMDLVRTILIKLEERSDPGRLRLDSLGAYSPAQICHHVEIMAQAGLIKVLNLKTRGDPYGLSPEELTWAGHDFLDAIRNESVWNQTKEKISSTVGTVSFEIMKTVAQQVTRQMLGIVTGSPLQ